MSATTKGPGEQLQSRQAFMCRLRKKTTGQAAHIPTAGEVELVNLSATPVEIAYRMTALQYLHLVVTGPDGRVVSEGHFGDRFAPTLEPQVLRLGPGDKFTANVHLLATVPRSPLPP